jgi:hypothetical protein
MKERKVRRSSSAVSAIFCKCQIGNLLPCPPRTTGELSGFAFGPFRLDVLQQTCGARMSASALAIALLGSAAEVFRVVVTSTNIASSMQKADRQ